VINLRILRSSGHASVTSSGIEHPAVERRSSLISEHLAADRRPSLISEQPAVTRLPNRISEQPAVERRPNLISEHPAVERRSSLSEHPAVERHPILITVSSSTTSTLAQNLPSSQTLSTPCSQPPQSSSKVEVVNSNTHHRVKTISFPKRIGFNSITLNKDVFNENRDSITKKSFPDSSPIISPTGPKHYDAQGNLESPHQALEHNLKSDDKVSPITPPPKRFSVGGTPTRHHYDAHGNEIISPEAAIHLRIKEARLNAAASQPLPHPTAEGPPKPYEVTQFRSRFEKSLVQFDNVPRPRIRFEEPRKPFNDAMHPQPRPIETFGDTVHPRPRLEHPQEPVSGLHGPRPSPRIEKEPEPFQRMRHVFKFLHLYADVALTK